MRCITCSHTYPDDKSFCPVCGTPNPNSGQARFLTSELAAGTMLHGKYKIDRVLGQGGFGITYAATHTVLNSKVAIKELFPEGTARQGTTVAPPGTLGGGGWQELKKNFILEAQTVARFNHPAIVRVMDIFEENGTAYLVMEYLEGQPLGKVLEKGPASMDLVEKTAREVAEALKVVHGNGLLHRDIKPDNIYLEKTGRVVLIDFGSARNFASGQSSKHTRLVTPGYAPLEQYATQATLGPYTDIYALGATLHHALTGQQPPDAVSRTTGAQLAPLPANMPRALRSAVEAAMQVEVVKRPQTADAFLSILGNKAAVQPAPQPTPKPNPQPAPQPKPQPQPTPKPSPQPAPQPRPQPVPQPAPRKKQNAGCVGCLAWVGGLSLVGVGVAAYLLYPSFLEGWNRQGQTNPPAQTQTQPETPTPVPSPETQPEQTVPPIQSPAVDPSRQPDRVPTAQDYRVVSGDLSSLEEANRLVEQVNAAGYRAYLDDANTNRVVVGPFLSQQDASLAQQDLQELNSTLTVANPELNPITPTPAPDPTPVPSEKNINPLDGITNPERKAILETYQSGDYSNTLKLADAWIPTHKTDALVRLTRWNATLQRKNLDTVTIGVSVPTSGDNVQVSEAVLQGVTLALGEAQTPPPVLISILNDHYDADIASVVSEEFAADAAVVGVIGPVSSGQSLNAAPSYNSSMVPQLLPTATDDRLIGIGDYTYRMAPTNTQQAQAMAQLMLKEGRQSVLVYYNPDNAYSNSLHESFIASAGEKDINIWSVEYPANGLPETLIPEGSTADSVFIAGGFTDVARIAKALKTEGINYPLYSGDSAYSQKLLQEARTQVEGIKILSFYHHTDKTTSAVKFRDKFRKAFGGADPNARAMQAYDSMKLMLSALGYAQKKNEGALPTREDMQSALQTFKGGNALSGVTSSIRFDDQQGIINRPFVILQVKNGQFVSIGRVSAVQGGTQ